jgi:DNA-binding response OmpR family regulator
VHCLAPLLRSGATIVTRPRPHILIVEAEEVIADITGFRLELLGFDVSVAYRGEQVNELLQSRKPDLFIIDLQLQESSGLALIEQVTASEATGKIPVVAISFDANTDQVQQAFAAGAADYLVAPFDPLVLEEKVSNLLSAPAAQRAVATRG